MGFFDFIFKPKNKERKSNLPKCPNCNAFVNLKLERCQSCGVRIKSMFRYRCPKCQELNEIDLKKCKKCFYDFEASTEKPKKTSYLCPICNYSMETIMTACPACGTKFM